MKGKLDTKKLLIIAGVVVLVIVALVLCIKLITGDKKASEEDSKFAEDAIRTYISSFTRGYDTIYGGVDLLYADNYKLEDLTTGMILNAAFQYAIENSLDIETPAFVMEDLEKNKEYKDITNYTGFKAETINQVIKDIFDLEVEELESIDELGYGYNIHYNETYDIYILGTNSAYAKKDPSKNIEYHIIKSTIKKDELKTYIAVAYTNTIDEEKSYFSDANQETEIKIGNKDDQFPTDKIDSFNKYVITFKKSDDRYIFASIEKES